MYNLQEFEIWVKSNEVRKNIPGISDYINSLNRNTNWTQYLEIIRDRNNFTPQEICLKTFKEWLTEVDERERELRR